MYTYILYIYIIYTHILNISIPWSQESDVIPAMRSYPHGRRPQRWHAPSNPTRPSSRSTALRVGRRCNEFCSWSHRRSRGSARGITWWFQVISREFTQQKCWFHGRLYVWYGRVWHGMAWHGMVCMFMIVYASITDITMTYYNHEH